MTHWIYLDLIILLFVIVVTGIMIPQILRVAFRNKLFDRPDQRKIHKTDIPRLGGIAFLPAILIDMVLFFAIANIMGYAGENVTLNALAPQLCYVGLAALILYATGIVDDLSGVRYSAKFLLQGISAAIVIAGGVRIESLYGFCGIHELPLVVSILLTGFFIVFIINALNLIDGVDGLASGLGGVACIFYAVLFLNHGMYVYSALATATLGTLLVFFVYNVFGKSKSHTKLFMGDTGSLVIGLILSVLCIECFGIGTDPRRANPAVWAVVPLLIPGFDVVRVYLRRIKSGRNPFLPDKTHIHHKLLAVGLSQKHVMLAIVTSSIILILFNYFLSPVVGINLMFVCDVAIWIGMNQILKRAIRLRERRCGTKLYT